MPTLIATVTIDTDKELDWLDESYLERYLSDVVGRLGYTAVNVELVGAEDSGSDTDTIDHSGPDGYSNDDPGDECDACGTDTIQDPSET